MNIFIGCFENLIYNVFQRYQPSSTIRHDLYMRYPTLFDWIKQFKKRTLVQGGVIHENKKKYFAGIESSNIENREIALNNSIRWIIKY
ncbi:MAG: hypothetical protein LC660_16190 [Desulfobacteraceae bacterium]|nr:hypothetical protein [Desulfobacteraceae bacterium]